MFESSHISQNLGHIYYRGFKIPETQRVSEKKDYAVISLNKEFQNITYFFNA